MNSSPSGIRWRRVVGAAFAAIGLSVLVLCVIVAAYAFGLALQARGAPDQSAINHFAAGISRAMMPWLEAALTFWCAVVVARKSKPTGALHGLLIGLLAGAISLILPLALAGRLSLQNAGFFALTVVLGAIGGSIGNASSVRP